MTRYAENTQVSPGQSRAEIERTLTRYGATEFAYGWQSNQAVVMFTLDEWRIRFIIEMPERSGFSRTPTGRTRTAESALAQWEQACRQRWRALALVIKAKLEAVDSGIVTLVEEFAAHVVLPGGQSVGDLMLPAIARAYTEDSPAPLLDAFGVRELPRGS